MEVSQVWMRVPYDAEPLRKEVLPQRNGPGRGCCKEVEFGKPGGPARRNMAQDVLDRLGLLLHCRKLLGKAFDSVAEKPSLGDGGVKKTCFVDALKLCQVESEMALLNHHGGYRLPEGPCRDFRSP